jgi:hypothetical protein
MADHDVYQELRRFQLMRAPMFFAGMGTGIAFLTLLLHDTPGVWWAGGFAAICYGLAGYLWRNVRIAVATPPRE